MGTECNRRRIRHSLDREGSGLSRWRHTHPVDRYDITTSVSKQLVKQMTRRRHHALLLRIPTRVFTTHRARKVVMNLFSPLWTYMDTDSCQTLLEPDIGLSKRIMKRNCLLGHIKLIDWMGRLGQCRYHLGFMYKVLRAPAQTPLSGQKAQHFILATAALRGSSLKSRFS